MFNKKRIRDLESEVRDLNNIVFDIQECLKEDLGMRRKSGVELFSGVKKIFNIEKIDDLEQRQKDIIKCLEDNLGMKTETHINFSSTYLDKEHKLEKFEKLLEYLNIDWVEEKTKVFKKKPKKK